MKAFEPEENKIKVARAWMQMIESDAGGIRELDIYPALRDWLRETQATRVLELGCGQGVCSQNLELGPDHEYTGLDESEVLIERARELYPLVNRRFERGDCLRLPFADGTFDGVFSVALWHLLGNLRTASEELARVIRAGGHFLIITAHPDSYEHWKARYSEIKLAGHKLTGQSESPDGTLIYDTLYLHSQAEIESALQSAGLAINERASLRRIPNSPGLHHYLVLGGRHTA